MFKVLIIGLCFFCTLPAFSGDGDISISWKVQLMEVSVHDSLSIDSLKTFHVQLFLDDSAFYVTRGKQRICYDFAKQKIYFMNLVTQTYDETSLFAEIDYRRSEFIKRWQLRSLLQQNKMQNPVGSLFDMESVFGLELDIDSLRPNLSVSTFENGIQFNEDSNALGQATFSEFPLGERKWIFEKFMLYETQLHPFFLRQLMDIKNIPDKLSFGFINLGKQYFVKYSLNKVKENASKSELNNALFIFGYQSKNPLFTVINKVYGFVNASAIIQESREDCIETFEAEMKKKNYVNAFLTLMETDLTQNQDFKSQFARLREKAETDRTFQDFIATLEKPQDSEQLNEQIRILKKLASRKKISKRYLINSFLADKYILLEETKPAFNAFYKVLSENPYITSTYVDLGDLFESQSNMRMAWKCYDIALLINPHHPLVAKIRSRRDYLLKNFPQYFF